MQVWCVRVCPDALGSTKAAMGVPNFVDHFAEFSLSCKLWKIHHPYISCHSYELRSLDTGLKAGLSMSHWQ